MKKKILFLIASLFILPSLFGCSCDANSLKEVKFVDVPEVIKTETQTQIHYTYDSPNARIDTIGWSISNSSLARITKDGFLTTFDQEGNFTLTITLTSGTLFKTTVSDSVLIRVKQTENPVSSINFNKEEVNLSIGNTRKLNFSYTAVDENLPCTTNNFIFKSSNEEIATVNNLGVVKALKEGTVFIDVTANDSLANNAICKLNISTEPSEKVRIIPSSLTIGINQPYDFSFVTTPKISDYTDLKWSVSDTTYASITNSGNFIANKIGKVDVNLSITTEIETLQDSCEVLIAASPIDVTYITLAKTSIDVVVGDEYSLTYNLLPTDTTTTSVEFISRDENVADVDEFGVIHSNNVGKTIIDVISNDFTKFSTSIEINVTERKATNIVLNRNNVQMFLNSRIKLIATVYGNDKLASNQKVIWKTSDKNIAFADVNGVIKTTGSALIGSSCFITAISEDGGFEATCKIEIIESSKTDSTKLNYTIKDYSNNCYNETVGSPCLGDVNFLIIPIWFTNSENYIKNTEGIKNDISLTYFGSNNETGWRSVKEYYKELSSDMLNISGTVADWYVTNISSTRCEYSKTVSILKNAVNYYFEHNPNDSRKNYDSDGDGYLDAVVLIYGAPDYLQDSKQPSNLWAFTSWLASPFYKDVEKPGPNAFFWASYDFMFSRGNDAKKHTGLDSSIYGNGYTKFCNIDAHTYIHETGHLFGLVDYYDYSYQYSPAGGFSMQDYNVGSHDPYSTMLLGWVDPYIPKDTCTITIGAFQKTKELILLTPTWNQINSPFDEYLLIELYTPTGLNEFDALHAYGNTYPDGSLSTGIRIWHVDARLVKSNGLGSFSKTPYFNPTVGNVLFMMSNTYGDSARISPLGVSYSNYNQLQLIRNDVNETYKPISKFNTNDLFLDGDVFLINDYKKQFVNVDKDGNAYLNSWDSFNWSFSINIVGSGHDAKANISLLKQ